MKNGYNDIEQLVEAYLAGHLSEKQVEAFEKEVQNNSKLSDELNIQQSIKGLMIENELLNLRDEFNDRIQQNNKKQKLKKIGLIATGLIILGSIAFYKANTKEEAPQILPRSIERTTVKELISKPEPQEVEHMNTSSALAKSEKPIIKLDKDVITVEKTPNVTLEQSEVAESIEAEIEVIKPNIEESKEVLETEAINCSELKPNVRFTVKPSSEFGDGEINMISKNLLINNFELEGESSESGHFTRLSADTYTISYEYNSCEYQIEGIEVPESICELNQSILYEDGSEFYIHDQETGGEIVVTNRFNQRIYEHIFHEDESPIWDATVSNERIESGVYRIQYTNKSETCIISLTIP